MEQPVVVNFVTFHSFIEEAIREKSMYADLMINESDVPFIKQVLQTYLIRKVGCFDLRGYVREGTISHWFSTEVMDEFDDLYLQFRDYLRTVGIDPNGNYILMRYLDQDNFILYEGTVNDPKLLSADHSSYEYDCSLPVECDPFL